MSVVSRSYFSYSVVLADYSDSNSIGANIRAVSGVNWTVDQVLSDGSLASPKPTIYGDRTGSTPPNNYDDTPGVEEGITDPNGLIEFWASPGEYRINISDPGNRIGDKEITWNSVPAWEGGLPGEFIESESLQGSQIEDGQVDTADIASNAVTTAKIASGNVTFAKLNSDVSELIPPIGTIMDYSGTGDPVADRWVLCDGRQLSQSIYANLYAVVGSYYNLGTEDAGKFRLPDLRGRVTVGQENMGTAQGAPATTRISSNNAIGNVAGASGVTLATNQIPSMSFSTSGGTDGHHSHGWSGSFTGSSGTTSLDSWQNGGIGIAQFQAPDFGVYFLTSVGDSPTTMTYKQHTHTFTPAGTVSGSVTGAGAHTHSGTVGTASPSIVENRQPYLVVNKIIRIK